MAKSLQVWIGIAILVTATAVAWFQPLRPSAFEGPELFSAGWWWYPQESHAEVRAPYLEELLYDMTREPGGGKYWAVGEAGLVLSSEDGWNWRDHPICLEGDSGDSTAFLADESRCPSGKASADENYAVSAPAIDRVWVGGDGGLFHTSDGGVSWRKAVLPESVDFPEVLELAFAGRGLGWALTDEGLLATRDGGDSWEVDSLNPDPDTDTPFTDIFFLDADRGWIVGSREIASTNDGGLYWSVLPAPWSESSAFSSLHGVYFLDERRGWATSSPGEAQSTVWGTEDGGKTWSLLARDVANSTISLYFLDEQVGWLSDLEGRLLSTSDGGRTWSQQRVPAFGGFIRVWRDPSSDDLWAVGAPLSRLDLATGTWLPVTTHRGDMPARLVSSSQTLLAAAPSGWVRESHDGGASWQDRAGQSRLVLELKRSRDGRLLFGRDLDETWVLSRDLGSTWEELSVEAGAIAFLDAKAGWAAEPTQLRAGSGLDIRATQDGGGAWKSVGGFSIGVSQFGRLADLHFADTERGWVALDDTWMERVEVRSTEDGGKNWGAIRSFPFPASGLETTVLTDDAVYVLAATGDLFATRRGSPEFLQLSESPPLAILTFLDEGDSGWGVGKDSVIYRTEDQGNSWQAQYRHEGEALTQIDFVDQDRGCVWGRPGVALCTQDGGATWVRTMEHRRSPAPWYYVAVLLGLGTIALGIRNRGPTIAQSAAEMLVPDRPLEATDSGAKALWPLAAGLSRFLRNTSTKPPMTLAVTGEWGSGKSSLMNLLCADLKKHAFRPVWFNVWHHQQEDQLLAALLENIRLQAIPKLWSRGGLAFRWRLLWVRARRLWFLALALIFSTAAFTGYFLANPEAFNRVRPKIEAVESLKGLVTGTEVAAEGALGVRIGGILSSFESGWTAPSVGWLLSALLLLAAFFRSVKAFGYDPAKLVHSVSANMGVRKYRDKLGFRYLFKREFADVTRALQPRNMVIVIDDLDRCQPEKVLEILESINFLVSCGECVVILGIDFDRVEEFVRRGFAQPEKTETASSPKPGLKEARRYLRKLINIEVPVPSLDADAFREIFAAGAEARAGEGGALLRNWGRRLHTWAPALLAVAALASGLYFGARPRPESLETSPAEVVAVNGADSVDEEVPPPESAQHEPDEEPVEEPTTSQKARVTEAAVFEEGKVGSYRVAHLGWFLLLGVGLVVWRIRTLRDIEHDSPAFTRALDVWRPLLADSGPSPREVKRFLNRLRYYAMMQRDVHPTGPWHRVLKRLGVPRPTWPALVEPTIPEDVLVALGTLQHVRPEWLDEEALYEDPAAFLRGRNIPEKMKERLYLLSDHGPIKAYRAPFQRLCAGLRL